MNDLQNKISAFAAEVVTAARASGLSWDEAVASLGIAAKAMAVGETEIMGKDDSILHAKKRLEEGFSQNARIVFAQSDVSDLKELSKSQVDAIADNANIKLFLKLN